MSTSHQTPGHHRPAPSRFALRVLSCLPAILIPLILPACAQVATERYYDPTTDTVQTRSVLLVPAFHRYL